MAEIPSLKQKIEKCPPDNFHVNSFCTNKFLQLQYFFEVFNLVINLISLFFSRRKALLCCLLLFLTYFRVIGQDCSCPPITTCGCDVGLTKLTVEYTGLIGLTVIVEDEGGIIHGGLLLVNGSTFDVESSAGVDQPFVGDLVTIRTTLAVLATINTSCVDPVTIGSTFGNYKVIDGESVGGVPICCKVMETSPPVISGCPTDISEFADPSSCGTNVSWQIPSVSDNCHVMSYIGSHNPGDFYEVGAPTLVTYTAIDDYGNETTCTFNVTVTDNTPPVISNCPSDITVSSSAGSCGAVVSWTSPTASDNCSITNFSSTRIPGGTFDVGTTMVTYTATDAAGNETTCSFKITVTDDTAPTFDYCPPSIIVSGGSDACGMDVSWLPPTPSDNCAVTSFTSTHNPGDNFPIGNTSITYTASDAAGNIVYCSFDIKVEDKVVPVINNCPSDIKLSAGASCQAKATWIEPTASDNCSATISGDHTPGEVFPLGITTVTYTAQDIAGNMTTCSFDVIVTDNTPPVIINCPTDINLSVNASCLATATWTEPTAIDNCSTTISSDHKPGDLFPLGTTTVTYTAQDNAGNITSCSFNVIVTDNVPPIFSTCPSDINLVADVSCRTVASWTEPKVIDDCKVTISSDHASGEAFPIGITKVTYTATDEAGNFSTCSFAVFVTDEIPPVFTNCPVDISVASTSSDCGTRVSWADMVATDNCTASPAITGSHNSGDFFAIGTTSVNYQAKDDSGNLSVCSFTVTVFDKTAPEITDCPRDINVSSDPGNCGVTVNWIPPTTTDNCSGSITTTSSHDPGEFFEIGSTIIEYSFTDKAGNTSFCTFNVMVNDNTPPVIENCPLDIILKGENLCDAEATWTAPTAADNCGLAELTSTHQPGDIFPEGTTEVTYTAKDINGNSSTCTFNVIIDNDDIPVISGCPEDISVRADETGKMAVSWSPPTAKNVCGFVVLVSSHDPGSEFPAGTTTVNYWDANDPEETILCSFNVEVIVIPGNPDIDISDVITPDGDDINDKWVIGNIEKFRDNKVVVSDRWGNVIYQAVGYNNETIVWTGLINSGKLAPTGTYFYYVEASSLNGDVIRETGFIELIQ